MASDQGDRDARVDEDSDTVALLIRNAGRRVVPPATAYEQTLAAASAALHAKIRARRRRRLMGSIAASVVLLAGLAYVVSHLSNEPVANVAHTDRIVGTVEVRVTNDSEWTTLRDDAQSLSRGSQVRTRAGSRAGLVLNNGVSLRIADATEVEMDSAARIRVLTGKVYLDSGAAIGPMRHIQVVTAAGIASDIGTQFEVLYLDGEYRLRVREGRVLLQRDSGEISSSAGEQVTIDTRGAIARSRLSPDDSAWQWVQAIAPTPDIDEQPVTVLLQWVARETGRSVKFENTEVEQKASATIVHGNIRHLTPLDALSVVLATTDLEYVLLDDGTILIRSKVSP